LRQDDGFQVDPHRSAPRGEDEWRIGKPMTKAQLAQALRPFKIRPKTLRVSGKTPKGYERSAFEEAWSSYCTAPMPPTAPRSPTRSATPQQPRKFNGFSVFSGRDTEPAVAV